MKEWKYLIGSANDFIGAPDWCTHVSKSSTSGERAWEMDSVVVIGNKYKWARFHDPEMEYVHSDGLALEIIAQRTESFGNAIDLEFCKANPDHPDCKCEEESKVADTNMGTLTYKVSLDLSEMDAEVSEAYYKKRAAYLAKKNKYVRICKGLPVDVYDVLQAFSVTNPATQHAIKKLLCAGLRGHKDKMQDLTEALKSIERAIELEKE